MEFASIISTIGTVAAILLFISPWPAVASAWNKKSVARLQIGPFLMMVASSYVWLLYGLRIRSTSIMLSNAIGVVCGAIYTFVFYTYANPDQRRGYKVLFGFQFLFYFILFWFFGSTTHGVRYAQQILGLLCASMSVFFYASPLGGVAEVIRIKSAHKLDRNMTITSIVCTASWALYGMLTGDYNIIVPNSIGLVLASVQMFLIFKYGQGGVVEQIPK